VPISSEALLYKPIKEYLESLGYEVKGEVGSCDLVACLPEDDMQEPLIVELKRSFSLALLYQGMQRLEMSDMVYLAVEAPKPVKQSRSGNKQQQMVRLCRRIGLGMLTVCFPTAKRKPLVEVLCHPEPYTPRKSSRKIKNLLREFHARTGDYNIGGTTRRKRMTAYREKSILCAHHLQQKGPLRPRDLRELVAEPKIGRILRDNYYGWFQSVTKGIYALSDKGASELPNYNNFIHDSLQAPLP
jgi:hypothetical protein